MIELMHDFVLFDGGIKKLPRAHQYFGVKAAQAHVREKKGGIIWHTQGSGKSIVMVLLAKWILENKPNARVAIVTDRDELDKQIEQSEIELRQLPNKIAVKHLLAEHEIVRLETERKMLTDGIEVICYRAETCLMNLV